MAIESILNGKYSHASDVWSFGILFDGVGSVCWAQCDDGVAGAGKCSALARIRTLV